MNTKITISILSLLIIMSNLIGNDNKQDITAPISLSQLRPELRDVQKLRWTLKRKLKKIVSQIAEGKQNTEDFDQTDQCKQLQQDKKQMKEELIYLRMKQSALYCATEGATEEKSDGSHIISRVAKCIEKGLYYSVSGECKNIVCQAIRDKVAGEFRARINNARTTEIAEIEQKIQKYQSANIIVEETYRQSKLMSMKRHLQELYAIPTRINQSAVKCELEKAQTQARIATSEGETALHFLLTTTNEGREYAQARKKLEQAQIIWGQHTEESKAAFERFKQAHNQLRETQQYKEVFESKGKAFLYWNLRKFCLDRMNRNAIFKGYDGKSDIENMYSGLYFALRSYDERNNDDFYLQVHNQVETELTAFIEQLRVDAGIEK